MNEQSLRTATRRPHVPVEAGEIPSLPEDGRVFSAERTVRLGDAGPDRRMRLDAVARFLHDVADDDAAEARLPRDVGWVLRKTRIVADHLPSLGDRVRLDTFCSGVGARWAERTTSLAVGGSVVVQGVAVWVAVHVATGAPARLDERFFRVYGTSAGSRQASARLALRPPSDEERAGARPWPLRTSDFDAWSHVNNAISWAAVEDAVDVGSAVPFVADVEHVRPIERGTGVVLARSDPGGDPAGAGVAAVWLLEESGAISPTHRVLSAARVEWRRVPSPSR